MQPSDEGADGDAVNVQDVLREEVRPFDAPSMNFGVGEVTDVPT